MTKKQIVSACVALAPDFSLKFEKPNDVPTVIARCTSPDGPLVLSMPIAGIGRAAVESRILEATLARLRKKAA